MHLLLVCFLSCWYFPSSSSHQATHSHPRSSFSLHWNVDKSGSIASSLVTPFCCYLHLTSHLTAAASTTSLGQPSSYTPARLQVRQRKHITCNSNPTGVVDVDLPDCCLGPCTSAIPMNELMAPTDETIARCRLHQSSSPATPRER